MSILRNGGLSGPFKKRKLSHSSETGGEAAGMGNPSPGPILSSGDSRSGTRALGRPPKDRAILSSTSSGWSNGLRSNQTGQSMFSQKIPSSDGLRKSSIVTIKLNELLSEVRPDYARQVSRLEETLQKLKRIIEELPEVPPVPAQEAERLLRDSLAVSIPFSVSRPGKETKYSFAYQKPANINVVGSVPLELYSTGEIAVDMAVTMPDAIFQTKDYVNHRVFHKRAYYLAQVAAGIKRAAKDEFDLSYVYQDDVSLLPALVIQPTGSLIGSLGSKVCIRILVAISASAFPIEKTLPTSNCVRISSDKDHTKPQEATPFYNSCLQCVASIAVYHKLLHMAIVKCQAFKEVCLLGRIWLRQRGFSSSISRGGFGPFEWAAVCALLLLGGGKKLQITLSIRYTSLQLFKALLQFLGGNGLTEPTTLRSPNFVMSRSDTPMLFDGQTGVNILFKMKKWSYQLLKHDAALTAKAINGRHRDNFESIFITRNDQAVLRFDEIFRIDIFPAQSGTGVEGDGSEIADRLYDILRQAFGDRVDLIHISTPPSKPWKVDQTLHKTRPDRNHVFDVELLLNAQHANRLVDHGPSADDSLAAAGFREFWGPKAELRRFKDGSISESLVWSEDRPVLHQIVNHILVWRLNIKSTAIFAWGSRVDRLLHTSKATVPPRDAFKLMNNAFQSLVSQLHSLEGLPLSVRSVLPVDSQLRYASLRSPLTSGLLEPANILIQFEGSAQWPDSLPAIQHTKIAFLSKVGELLSSSNTSIKTRVGLENSSTSSSGHHNTSFLDITYPPPSVGLGPISFRLRIYQDREQTLLERGLALKDLHGAVHDSLVSALATHRRDYLALPRHSTAIQNMCTRYPAFSPTIRLLKKWTASHLLLSPHHVPEELLELIVAKVFVHPYPWSTPATAQTGLLRALNLLARWNWATEPLIVDLSGDGEITSDQVSELHKRFEAWRGQLDPGMNNVVLFVGSNVDLTGVVWTQGARPSRVVASQLSALAMASIDVVESEGLRMTDEHWRSLFKSPIENFDFVIHLKMHAVGASADAKTEQGSRYKNLVLQEEMDTDRTGFDVLGLFIEDLRNALGHNVLFFHDSDGGKVIAGIWNPRSLERKAWKVRSGFSSLPVGSPGVSSIPHDDRNHGKGEAVMNQEGVLAEIAMLGEGIVEQIEIVKKSVM